MEQRIDQKITKSMEEFEATREQLYEMIDSGSYTSLVKVATNKSATYDHLLEVASLCNRIPNRDNHWREGITEAVLSHHDANDTLASLLCINGYFAIWMMVAKSTCAGERSLSKLAKKCELVRAENRQEELARAIADNRNATIRVLELMAYNEKAPHAQKIGRATLRFSSKK